MKLLPSLPLVGLAVVLALNAGGCAGLEGLGRLIPGFNTVTVEVVNDTGFAVDPNIRFDDDAGFFAGLLPADTLDTGLIPPGEARSYTFDCDELGLIVSDEAEQVIPLFGTYTADKTANIERGEEFDCGDVIRFRFVGDGVDFGVIVSVNGKIVD